MATTYNYDWNGWPKFRVVVNEITTSNRTATSVKVNYKVTVSINGWYHYDLNFTIKCGNGSKTHKLNPWGTKNDNSNVYRDSRTLTGSFTITNLSETSSNPGVVFSFSSSQNKHGNVSFGSTSNGSSSSIKVSAFTGSKTNTPTNVGSGNKKPSTPSNSGTSAPVAPTITITPGNYGDFPWDNDANTQATQWTYDTFKITDELRSIFAKMDSMGYMKSALSSSKDIGGESDGSNDPTVKNGIYKHTQEVIGNPTTISVRKSGILGVPFQFNDYADVKDSKYGFNYIGRSYSKFIWNNMPIVYFEMGKPLYFDAMFSNKDSSISRYVSSLYSNNDEAAMASDVAASRDYMLGLGGLSKTRYYTFMDDFFSYSQYVNTMFRYVAITMGFGDDICPILRTNKTYRHFDLREVRDDSFWGKLITSNYIAVYYDPAQSSIGESGSNSVGESVMSTMFTNVNAISREVQYLFGADLVTDVSKLQDNSQSLADTVTKLAQNLSMSDNGLINRLSSLTSCISGANILFPYMWQDSQFSKSYNLHFKFSTPYGDPESVLLNIYLPYLCLLAMSMPRQAVNQGYKSPFIIKASSKGWFNCDMGMVESIDIKRGGSNNDQWTVDGLPTEIDITLSIRDLYPVMMATTDASLGIMLSGNSAFTDYLGMLSGIDMHIVTPMDKSQVLAKMIMDEVVSMPATFADKLKYEFNSFIKHITTKYWD